MSRLQFGIGTLLAVTLACGLLLGGLRWLGLPPATIGLVMAIVAVGAATAIAVAIALARWVDSATADQRDDGRDDLRDER